MENREYKRTPSGFLVRLKIQDRNTVHVEKCLNLSVAGLFIMMDDPPPRGMQVHLELDLRSGAQVVEVEAVVIWARPKMPDARFPSGIGIKFVNMSEETRAIIEKALDSPGLLTDPEGEASQTEDHDSES